MSWEQMHQRGKVYACDCSLAASSFTGFISFIFVLWCYKHLQLLSLVMVVLVAWMLCSGYVYHAINCQCFHFPGHRIKRAMVVMIGTTKIIIVFTSFKDRWKLFLAYIFALWPWYITNGKSARNLEVKLHQCTTIWGFEMLDTQQSDFLFHYFFAIPSAVCLYFNLCQSFQKYFEFLWASISFPSVNCLRIFKIIQLIVV
jgi:hypothetical protein